MSFISINKRINQAFHILFATTMYGGEEEEEEEEEEWLCIPHCTYQ
jgi:hypothetical protein